MKQLTPLELNRPAIEEYKSVEKLPVIVVLDNIRSGLNVGAIFRTADAFNIKAIYLCGITGTPPHAEIMKTALGATESVNWHYFEKTTDALSQLRAENFQLVPVEQTTKSQMLDEFSFYDHVPMALIFGNEMRGVDKAVLEMCNTSIEIPQEGIKHSLNVATSAGIVLWECYRYLRRRNLSSL